MKKSNVDKISGLSDGVIHHILSFLDMKVVIQTSILSKRWRNLWKSTPTLNFKLKRRTSAPKRTRTAFMHFVYRVLLLRDDSNIHKFCLICTDRRVESSHKFSWIVAAIGRNVQELSLDLGDHIEWPHQLFTSNIKTLDLDWGVYNSTPLPKSFCSASWRIKVLILREATFPDGDSNGVLALSCSVLETLSLRHCRVDHLKIFNISTSPLKTLDVYYFNTGSCKVKICCPNLASLDMSYEFGGDYVLENVSALATVDINVYYDFCRKKMLDELYGQRLADVLRGFSNIKALTLGGDPFLEILTNRSDLLERIPNLFHSLRFLKLKGWSFAGVGTHALAMFLQRLPSIETIIVYVTSQGCSSENQEASGKDFPFPYEFYSLKTFKIVNPRLNKDEMKFIKILLKRAIVLKEIVVKTRISDSSYGEMLAEFQEKLVALPRASAGASVSFQ